jgi:hypothetical protein
MAACAAQAALRVAFIHPDLGLGAAHAPLQQSPAH